MKRLWIWMGIAVVAVLTSLSCGGGGGGDTSTTTPATTPTQPETVQINSMDSTNVEPLARLTITGTGFNLAATITVSFSHDDISLNVPVLEATTTSVTVVVPPYIDKSTGDFDTGTVSVQVTQNSASGSATSNTLSGLQIAALPALTLSPGEITANVAAFMELSLTDTINRVAELDSFPGSQNDTTNLRTQLEALRLQYSQLKDKVRNAIANPDQAETIGTINGVSITLDQESLTAADQLMAAMINEVLPQLQITSPAPQRAERLATSSAARKQADISSICDGNPQLCTASGEPLITVKNYHTGEETAVAQYEYAMALPGASEILGNIMNWFAATTATIGAVAVTAGVSMPIAAVAAITEVNVTCMVAKYGLDASRLTANYNDKDAAKALLDDFNGTLAYMRDSVLSPTAAAISEKAGVVYDLIVGWQPIVSDQIPSTLTDLENYFDTNAVAPNVTGSWSGTLNNPNLGIVGCEGGQSYYSLSLTEDLSMNISGSTGFGSALSGSRDGNLLAISANSPRFGARGPFTWTWDGSNTINGSVAYFCWSLDTGALLTEGVGTFTVTRD
jgi:hypothetical protein